MMGPEKPRVLIVSSEHLHPGNLLGSIFELTQAKRLRTCFDVSILSVRVSESFGCQLKKWIKTRGSGGLSKTALVFRQMYNSKPKVQKYHIEGIDVYEASSTPLIAQRSFNGQMDYWVTVAMEGFNAYFRERGVPHLLHAHGRYLMAGSLALRIKDSRGVPFVYTEHSTWYRRGIAPVESKPTLRNVLRESSRTIAVSDDLLRDMTAFAGMSSDCSIVHPNTFDDLFEVSEPNWTYDEKRPLRLLTVASLEEKKGIDVLLDAVKILATIPAMPDFLVSIFGDGPSRDVLLRRAEELDISGIVSFEGTADKDRLIREYDQADIFVLPSRFETFGVVVIEALSRGCPVVVTRSGGPEKFVTSRDGEICDAGDTIELADSILLAIKKLHTYNRSEIRASAIERWGGDAFLRFMRGVYQQAIEDKIDAVKANA